MRSEPGGSIADGDAGGVISTSAKCRTCADLACCSDFTVGAAQVTTAANTKMVERVLMEAALVCRGGSGDRGVRGQISLASLWHDFADSV